MKICIKCFKEKQEVDFANNRKQCKLCRSKYKYLRKKNDIGYLLYSSAKIRATKKNIEFNLTPNYVRDLVPKDNKCPIFKIEMISNFGGIALDNSFSLDRINPKLGYVKGNIMIISYRANVLKNNANIEELELILNFLKEQALTS